MRQSALLLVPIAAVAAVAPAPARADSVTYLSVEQAQRLLFPNAGFTRDFIQLSEKQYDAIRDTAQVTQWVREIKAWRVSTGGWFVVDEVPGRDDMIFYAVGLDANGVVTGIEIMECLPKYDDVRSPVWRRQFTGAKGGQYLPERIQTISGSSLSSVHIRDGIKRVLVTYDQLLRQRR